ncbi:MFS transporter [Streptomyces sp. NPDC048384]|uniref:MFS transporter n=1 Tax=Streptomyces sp. NPDC048384 TaxID=3155487 RepID=UPI00343161FC
MHKHMVLTACCLSVVLIGFDVTAVNLALPSMAQDLHAGINGMQWVIASYSLATAVLLLTAGSIGDRLGYKVGLTAGVGIFTLASMLCGVASSHQMLVIFRVVQAVGAALIVPMSMSLISRVFPDTAERARKLGAYTAAYALGMALGPVLGGAVVDSIGWRLIFWINLPVGLATLLLTARYAPTFRPARASSLDVTGQLLVIALLGPTVYAIIEAPRRSWTSVEVMVCMAVAAAALISLLTYERHRRDPLIDQRYFRSAPFTCAMSIALVSFAAFSGVLFLSTLYLQNAKGFSALRSGVWLLPLAVMVGICGPLAGHLTGRYGPRSAFVVAGAANLAGGLLFVLGPPDMPDAWLLTGYALFGAGIGLSNSPSAATVVAGVPRDHAGVATALLITLRRVGFCLGVAVMGSILASAEWHDTGSILEFANAAQPGWWAVTFCGLAELLLGLVATSTWALHTAERTRAALREREP